MATPRPQPAILAGMATEKGMGRWLTVRLPLWLTHWLAVRLAGTLDRWIGCARAWLAVWLAACLALLTGFSAGMGTVVPAAFSQHGGRKARG